MLEHLADWYREAGIEPNADTLPKHRDAIEQYRPDAVEIVSFARVFYGFITDEDPSLSRLASALRASDPALPTTTIKQLMAVVCGATLVSQLDRADDHKLSDLAALVLVSGAAQSLRTDLPVVEIPRVAARYLERRTSTRASENFSTDDEVDGDARVAALEHQLATLGEETNMLWWLVSEFSRDRAASWATVGAHATPVIAGKELADLTRVMPGPVSAAAFLDRVISTAGGRAKTVKVKEAIDEIPRDWRETNAPKQSRYGVEDLTPISNGLRLSLTVSDGEDWSNVFEKGTRFTAQAKLAPASLGYQMYLECLLARLAVQAEQGK